MTENVMEGKPTIMHLGGKEGKQTWNSVSCLLLPPETENLMFRQVGELLSVTALNRAVSTLLRLAYNSLPALIDICWKFLRITTKSSISQLYQLQSFPAEHLAG